LSFVGQRDLDKPNAPEFVESLVDGKSERDSIYMIGALVEDDVLLASSAALDRRITPCAILARQDARGGSL
jgi:hypothetical protein